MEQWLYLIPFPTPIAPTSKLVLKKIENEEEFVNHQVITKYLLCIMYDTYTLWKIF